MTLDDILEKSTIQFPEPLSLQEAQDLLQYIAENLPADIHYLASYHSVFRTKDHKATKEDGTVDITGDIKRLDKDLAFDSFRMHPSDQDCTRMSALCFERIQGYELREYRPEVIRLWDDVRATIQKYFENTKKQDTEALKEDFKES